MSNAEILEYAIPHEAGHVVVSKAFNIPVQHIGFRLKNGLGTPIASIWQPDDHELNDITDKQRDEYCCGLAGGIAGELFALRCYDPSNDEPQTVDRVLLARLTIRDILEFVPAAKHTIHHHRRVFRQLCSKMKLRYPDVRREIETSNNDGVFMLVTSEELDQLWCN